MLLGLGAVVWTVGWLAVAYWAFLVLGRDGGYLFVGGLDEVAKRAGGSRSLHFYRLMDELDWRWEMDADKCAFALRQYADKYHPEAPKHQGIPESVTQIFHVGEAA